MKLKDKIKKIKKQFGFNYSSCFLFFYLKERLNMNLLKNNKLSKEDQLSLDNAKDSLAIEGLIVTENETKILEDYINGLITEADFLKILNTNCN